MLKAINIKWDTDGDKEVFDEFPTETTIPDYLEEIYRENEDDGLDEIADWLSEETGFCHEGFKIARKSDKENDEFKNADFLDDEEKMNDFSHLTKEEF